VQCPSRSLVASRQLVASREECSAAPFYRAAFAEALKMFPPARRPGNAAPWEEQEVWDGRARVLLLLVDFLQAWDPASCAPSAPDPSKAGMPGGPSKLSQALASEAAVADALASARQGNRCGGGGDPRDPSPRLLGPCFGPPCQERARPTPCLSV